MQFLRPSRAIGLIPGMFPVIALAQAPRSITVATGIRMSFITAVEKILIFATGSIVAIATILFLVGAVYMVAGGMNATNLETAKKLMKGSLIGMAITLGAYTILRTAIYFLYVQPGYIT